MKDRVISTIVIILLIIAMFFFDDSFPLLLNISISIISMFCVHEIIKASGLTKHKFFYYPSIVVAFLVPLFTVVIDEITLIIYAAYSVAMFLGLMFHHTQITFRDLATIYSMSVLIPCALQTIVLARELDPVHGAFYSVIACVAAWIPDVGAFIVGTFFGKRKLAPKISPKKTVEGLIGGVVTNIIALAGLGVIFAFVYTDAVISVSNLMILGVIGLFGALVGTMGDLSFSLIKRSCGIKDFGQIIPGHGGLLDRFDSVIFTAPFVYILFIFLPLVS